MNKNFWNDDNEEELISMYKSGKSLEEIGKHYGKSVPSIRTKLAILKVYKKKKQPKRTFKMIRADIEKELNIRFESDNLMTINNLTILIKGLEADGRF